MRKEELPQVRALMERSFEPYLRPIFFIHPQSTLVAVDGDDTVVAGINLDIYGVRNGAVKIGYIGWLYTDAPCRGAGLGGRLIDAAIAFLGEQGCTDVGACIEGDNPSSFKQLSFRGFSILPLVGQIKRFGFGLLTVWRHASRFFDMGYFFWHKRLDAPDRHGQGMKRETDGSLRPSQKKQAVAMAGTGLACSLLWILALLRKGVAQNLSPLALIALAAFPLALLSWRSLAMRLTAKAEGFSAMFLPWDTAWLAGILLPVLTGWPFPVPGNWYVAGTGWRLEKERKHLGVIAVAGVLASLSMTVACKFLARAPIDTVWSGTPVRMLAGLAFQYSATLLVLDLFFFFYPFCGFNGSRVRRLSLPLWAALTVLSIAIIIA